MKKIILTVLLALISVSSVFARSGTVLDDRVRLRSAPDLKYSQVEGYANKDDVFEIIAMTETNSEIDGYNEPWYLIQTGNQYKWIYGGYFKAEEVSNSWAEIETYSKSGAMLYSLWGMIFDHISETRTYYSKGTLMDTRTENWRSPEGWMGVEILVFKSGPFIIEAQSSLGDTSWCNSEMVENADNPINIKLGISESELKEIFGSDILINEWNHCDGNYDEVVKFNFSNGKLKSISFGYMGLL